MNLTIDSEIALKVGFLRLASCHITASGDALRDIYTRAASRAREAFTGVPLGEHPVAAGVRRLFKSVGIDPSRYRPSGEALVRRVLKGQKLHEVNCIVDINNICSIETLFPLGAYDCKKIVGDVHIRLGTNDEIYRGIGKEINIAGKLVSSDREGAFGSPIADSTRTKISENVDEVLVLLYAPDSTEDSEIHDTLNRFADLASAHAGAQMKDFRIYPYRW
jgi:DNA/RNA-binding domain of Phe-tRNA-synthetase-like protein